MKEVFLNEDITLHVSEGNEIFEFANKALDHKFYVPGFSLKETLIQINFMFNCNNSIMKKKAEEKTRGSFIALICFKGEYVGLCLFFKFQPYSVQTFVKNEYRKKGIAFMAIKSVLTIIKEKGEAESISFHHGNADSIILFYKLWKLRLIKITNILTEENRKKLRYIKKRSKGEICSCHMSINEHKAINDFLMKMKSNIK